MMAMWFEAWLTAHIFEFVIAGIFLGIIGVVAIVIVIYSKLNKGGE